MKTDPHISYGPIYSYVIDHPFEVVKWVQRFETWTDADGRRVGSWTWVRPEPIRDDVGEMAPIADLQKKYARIMAEYPGKRRTRRSGSSRPEAG